MYVHSMAQQQSKCMESRSFSTNLRTKATKVQWTQKKILFSFFFAQKWPVLKNINSWANCYKRCIVTKHKNLILHLLIDEKLFYQSTKYISKHLLPLENYLEEKISRFFINSFLILKDSELHMHYQSFQDNSSTGL